jgi:hypothetical protein
MKALVLSYDRYRPITEHMLKTYEQLWPDNAFTFRIPYQINRRIESHSQRVELVASKPDVLSTLDALLRDIPDDEWVYWCIDDKFVVHIDSESASYFGHYVTKSAPLDVGGLCFCRARWLLTPPHVSDEPIMATSRGDALLRRYDFNQIWLHQFLRARVLKRLFALFPKYDFRSSELDVFTRQGRDALTVPPDEMLCVTERNFVVLGESTTNKRITRTYVQSMEKWGMPYPRGFDVDDGEIIIGSLGPWQGE